MLFLRRWRKLSGEALRVQKQGGVPAMCYSCLCVRLCSHGNHLSPLLFLKSTCACGSTILKKMMLTPPFLDLSQVNNSSSTRYLSTWAMPDWCQLLGEPPEVGRTVWGRKEEKILSSCGLGEGISLRNKTKIHVRKTPPPLVHFQSHGW